MNQLDYDLSRNTTTSGDTQPGLFGGFEECQPRKRKARRRVTGKNYIIDTNVLLHDPHCIHCFADNHVWIPVDVLSELDRFKNEQSDRGANARAVHRSLSAVFDGKQNEAILDGIPTPGGGTLRLAIYDPGDKSKPVLERFRRVFPEHDRTDHRILACVLVIRAANPAPTILVTKDLNMRLKAQAMGIQCEDYLTDKVEACDVESYRLRTLEVSPHELQRFASSGQLEVGAGRASDIVLNEYILLSTSDHKTMPGRFGPDGRFRRLTLPDAVHIPRGINLRPANLGQQCFLDALLDPSISLVTCYGPAGTGKTLVAVAAGLHAVFNKTYNGITVSRPVIAMGDTLGFLPGSLTEKMRPWLQPIYDAFDVLMPPPGLQREPTLTRKQARKLREGSLTLPPSQTPQVRKPYESLMELGVVEIEALCYIRGRSIPRRFFVLDEAQQLTPLEAKTVVTRMSKGSKLVLIGDPAQIDNPYVDSRSNGLVYTRNRLKGEVLAAHICLSKGERSALAEAGARLM
jgi:PhoH-like ATPase